MRRTQRAWLGLGSTAVCFVLAKHARGVDPEQGLLAGLLHDIGTVPILMYAEQYDTLVNDSQLLEKTIKELKTELGGVILKRWSFSEEMINATQHSENWRYQHEGLAPSAHTGD